MYICQCCLPSYSTVRLLLPPPTCFLTCFFSCCHQHTYPEPCVVSESIDAHFEVELLVCVNLTLSASQNQAMYLYIGYRMSTARMSVFTSTYPFHLHQVYQFLPSVIGMTSTSPAIAQCELLCHGTYLRPLILCQPTNRTNTVLH